MLGHPITESVFTLREWVCLCIYVVIFGVYNAAWYMGMRKEPHRFNFARAFQSQQAWARLMLKDPAKNSILVIQVSVGAGFGFGAVVAVAVAVGALIVSCHPS